MRTFNNYNSRGKPPRQGPANRNRTPGTNNWSRAKFTTDLDQDVPPVLSAFARAAGKDPRDPTDWIDKVDFELLYPAINEWYVTTGRRQAEENREERLRKERELAEQREQARQQEQTPTRWGQSPSPEGFAVNKSDLQEDLNEIKKSLKDIHELENTKFKSIGETLTEIKNTIKRLRESQLEEEQEQAKKAKIESTGNEPPKAKERATTSQDNLGPNPLDALMGLEITKEAPEGNNQEDNVETELLAD